MVLIGAVLCLFTAVIFERDINSVMHQRLDFAKENSGKRWSDLQEENSKLIERNAVLYSELENVQNSYDYQEVNFSLITRL